MNPAQGKYEQLIDDLRADLRPQREWCEGRGIFMVLGHFVVGVAGGTWLFSLIYDSRAGLALALALGALGGLLHLANLGRPERALKMASRIRSSWISRGFHGLLLFLAGGAAYLWSKWFAWAPWQSESPIGLLALGVSIVGMVLIIGYMGFVYTASKGVPFWNSPLHPALYVTYALRGGIAGLLLALVLEDAWRGSVEDLLWTWTAITAAAVAFFSLEVHGAITSRSAAARRSVEQLFRGPVALSFYGGTLLLGLVVPAWLAWSGLSGAVSVGMITLLAIASAFGDFFVKYSTIRAGVYLPIWMPRGPGGRSRRNATRGAGKP